MKKKHILRKVYLLILLCFSTSFHLLAQNTLTLKSRVVDAKTKEPLIGVSVKEDKTTNATMTDTEGYFTLKARKGTLINISYIGYSTLVLKAEDIKSSILLKEDNKTLDEVVVVGYGVQKKVNLSGSVSAINGDVIAAKPSSDALAALQGVLPGVSISRTGGQPGYETSGMEIRGATSTNTTQTLVLVDGIESELALVNPNDIASISVLKDAAAAAIYGARAAAGVILVTTKSGTSGKPQVSYSGYYAINRPGNMPERLPAWEEQAFINESRVNQNGSPEWNEEQTSWVSNPNFNYRENPNGRWDFFQATHWVHEGTKKNMYQQNHSISVSGGTKELKYYISGNYFSKKGLLKYGPDKNERYNLRLKLDAELNPYVSLNINSSYQGQLIRETPYGAANILERLYRVRGKQPIYNPEDALGESSYNGDLQVNVIDIMKNGGSKETHYENFVVKGTLSIHDLVKGLRVNLSASRKFGYDSRESTKRYLAWYNRLGTSIRFKVNDPNSLIKMKNDYHHDLLEATVNYDFKLGKEHTFNLLGGTTYENYRKNQIEGTAKSLISNDFYSFNYYDASVATNSSLSDLIEPWAMMSYFGRLNYNFMDRYLFEANVRYDGSSRLSPGYHWKAFPSFSVAWRINEEKWFDVQDIDNLKLRASSGQLGNGAVLGLYDYLALVTDGTHIGESYYYQKMLASRQKTWETIETTNVGVDFGLLKNRLTVTADYYWKYNKNMLAPINLPSQIGIGTSNANVGNLKTWGWEIEVAWRDKIRNLNYQVSLNLSDSKNLLKKYSGLNVISAGTVDLLEGYAINSIWGYRTDGYWNSREEYLAYKTANSGYESFQDAKVSGGDVKYMAQGKADHQIGIGGGTPENPGDLVCLGNSSPRYLYGLSIGLQWKNFDFSMLWQGVGKRKILIDSGTLAPFSETSLMPWTIHRDYCKVDKDGNLTQAGYWPRLYNYNKTELFNYHPSDKWVQNASYIRLKNIQLGYTLPVNKKIAERLRVYVSGNDVWEHSDLLSVFDPEVKNKATAGYYPFFRTWNFGLNITF